MLVVFLSFVYPPLFFCLQGRTWFIPSTVYRNEKTDIHTFRMNKHTNKKDEFRAREVLSPPLQCCCEVDCQGVRTIQNIIEGAKANQSSICVPCICTPVQLLRPDHCTVVEMNQLRPQADFLFAGWLVRQRHCFCGCNNQNLMPCVS